MVRRTEPNLNLVEYFGARASSCPIGSACGLKPALARAEGALFAELEQYRWLTSAHEDRALIELWQRDRREVPA